MCAKFEQAFVAPLLGDSGAPLRTLAQRRAEQPKRLLCFEKLLVGGSFDAFNSELLNEVGGAVSVPGQFSEAKSAWVAQLVTTIDALTMHSPATRDVALKSGYVDRLLRIVASQLNIRAPLLTAVLRSLSDILMDCEEEAPPP